jgi:uncharacterized LabA/DUF88 family protein
MRIRRLPSPLSQELVVKSVGVFVNSSLLFYVVQSEFKRVVPNSRIDYKAYLEQAIGEDRLYRAFAYGAQIENEAAGFIECLQRTGFETRYVPAKQVNGKNHVLDTDRNMDLALDVIRILDRLDTVVIGSNDPNLIPLVKYLKERGLKVVIFAARIPRELARAANEVREITEMVLEHAHHPAAT